MPLKGILSGWRHGTKNSQHPKKEKLVKNLLQTLRYGQHFIFVPVVTVVLTNHPSYVCYLGSCFRPRFRCGAVPAGSPCEGQGEQLPLPGSRCSVGFGSAGHVLWRCVVLRCLGLSPAVAAWPGEGRSPLGCSPALPRAAPGVETWVTARDVLCFSGFALALANNTHLF